MKEGLDIVFSGSRTLKKETVYRILDKYKISKLYVGDCKSGGDKFALQYAEEHLIDHEVYEAYWDIYGRAGGVVRNKFMVKDAKEKSPNVFGIAIRKKMSKGTTDAIKHFNKYLVPHKVHHIGYTNKENRFRNEVLKKEERRYKKNENVEKQDVA